MGKKKNQYIHSEFLYDNTLFPEQGTVSNIFIIKAHKATNVYTDNSYIY